MPFPSRQNTSKLEEARFQFTQTRYRRWKLCTQKLKLDSPESRSSLLSNFSIVLLPQSWQRGSWAGINHRVVLMISLESIHLGCTVFIVDIAIHTHTHVRICSWEYGFLRLNRLIVGITLLKYMHWFKFHPLQELKFSERTSPVRIKNIKKPRMTRTNFLYYRTHMPWSHGLSSRILPYHHTEHVATLLLYLQRCQFSEKISSSTLPLGFAKLAWRQSPLERCYVGQHLNIWYET